MLLVKERQINDLAGMGAAIRQAQRHLTANPVTRLGKPRITNTKTKRWRGNASGDLANDNVTINDLAASALRETCQTPNACERTDVG